MAAIPHKKYFTAGLLKWNNEKNSRIMPWKGEKDPYKIWLSEIILQQTRVEQGMAYYNKFVKTFPTIKKLANASETKVMKLWEGLGYYTRCRNLMSTARFISKELNGVFPDSFETIKSLKGVGPYTAAAIASFAFNQPHAVVDGNVHRVLSRFFGIKTPVDSSKGKNQFAILANDLIDKKKPGVYNQAIMDFGAVICKPVSPNCKICNFKKNCYAFNHNVIDTLPVKAKKNPIKKRWLYYLVPVFRNEIFIRQRSGKDIWNQLHEFLLFEQPKKINKAELDKIIGGQGFAIKTIETSGFIKQQLSHQQIHACFTKLILKQKPKSLNNGIWVTQNQLRKFAFPGVIREFNTGLK